MYRAASSSIGGSKWLRGRIWGVAVRSASSNVSRVVSSCPLDPCSDVLHPTHDALPEAVNPLETRMDILQDVGNCTPELGASLGPKAIDLESRGLAVLRKSSPNPWKAHSSIAEETGHRVLPFDRSATKISERKNNTFQRRFSSLDAQVPVIRQVMCYDDYELQNAQLVPLRNCLHETSILKPISPDGLFRPADLRKFDNLVLGGLGHPLLRQTSALATVNLMRGINISQLLKLDNMLWSPLYKCIVLDKSTLTGDIKAGDCPYRAVRDVFLECLEMSTELGTEKVRIPLVVLHLLKYLEDAEKVDKRLITNHSATMFPWERIHRYSRINQLLRQEPTKDALKLKDDEDLCLLMSRKWAVLYALGFEFPFDLLLASGLHPVIDSWAREGQRMRGVQAGVAPIVLPKSPVEKLRNGTIIDKYELFEALSQDQGALLELGKILVALHRDPYEHLYDPLHAGKWLRLYTVLAVDELLSSVSPGFGPMSAKYFLEHLGWSFLEGDPESKPRYCCWTNT